MHKLLVDQPGNKVLMLGNEAIARGAIEAGGGVRHHLSGNAIIGALA